jgi:hypothetical protein
MAKNKELLIVAGLPRSGTTWLEGILNAHPDIFLYHEIDDADAKEKHFATINYKINSDTEKEYKSSLLKGIDYLKHTTLFNPYKKQKATLVGFKTVGRFTHPTVFTWMRKTLDFPKTIFIIRHPGGFAASQLRFPSLKNIPAKSIIAREQWYIESLHEKVDPSITLEKFHALFWKLSNERILIDNMHTPNFHFVIYEDLCRSPQKTTQKIFDFLQLKLHNKVSKYLDNSINPDRNLITRLRSKRFYSTTKNPLISANKWMKELSADQQAAIQSVVADSFLMKYWEQN